MDDRTVPYAREEEAKLKEEEGLVIRLFPHPRLGTVPSPSKLRQVEELMSGLTNMCCFDL